MEINDTVPGDPKHISNIVSYLKDTGLFDEIRRECLVDVETKSSFQNMSNRVDDYTAQFLANETWKPDLNKEDVKSKLQKDLHDSGILTMGADHVVEQVINPKIQSLFLPKIIEAVENLNKKQEPLSGETSRKSTTNARPTVFESVADILSSTPVPLIKTKKQVLSDQTAVSDILTHSEKEKKVIKKEAVKLSKQNLSVSRPHQCFDGSKYWGKIGEELVQIEPLKKYFGRQNSRNNIQDSASSVTTLAENDVPAPPERKRRLSSRQRKPNSKYSSDEYCLNSRLNTVITKQKSGPNTKKSVADDANKDIIMRGTKNKTVNRGQ